MKIIISLHWYAYISISHWIKILDSNYTLFVFLLLRITWEVDSQKVCQSIISQSSVISWLTEFPSLLHALSELSIMHRLMLICKRNPSSYVTNIHCNLVRWYVHKCNRFDLWCQQHAKWLSSYFELVCQQNCPWTLWEATFDILRHNHWHFAK